jgi:hypothetical protein
MLMGRPPRGGLRHEREPSASELSGRLEFVAEACLMPVPERTVACRPEVEMDYTGHVEADVDDDEEASPLPAKQCQRPDVGLNVG